MGGEEVRQQGVQARKVSYLAVLTMGNRRESHWGSGSQSSTSLRDPSLREASWGVDLPSSSTLIEGDSKGVNFPAL